MNTALDAAPLQVTTLDRRRVYILPTRYGFTLSLMLLAILLGSINYDNALGYMLTFLLASLFLTAILHTFRNLSAITCLGVDAEPVFAGDPAHFVVSIENNTGSERYCLALGFTPQRRAWLQRRSPDLTMIENLPANAVARAALQVETGRRGWLQPERIRISSTFPLGILVAWAYFPAPRPCLVYPKPSGDERLPAPSAIPGGDNTGEGTGNDDFAGVRPYAHGDRARDISWKSFAKDDALVVKRFTGEASDELWLKWADTTHLGDAEARLSQLALWVVIAARAGLHFGLTLPEQTVAVGAGDVQHERCLRALAEY